MIIVKQSHFHCSRHSTIVKSIHITPNVFHQPSLFHYTCVYSSWECQPCQNSQDLLQVSHPFSKHSCISSSMSRAQSCTASEYKLILNSYCKFLCQVWHNQTLHKYSHFGNISLLHSF